MPITLFDIAIKTLETAKMPLTAEEIWVKSEELKTRAGFESKGKTPVASISARCYMEIQTKGEQSKLYQHSTRPTTFYLTKWKGQYIAKETAEDDNKAEPITKIGWKERDLHPLLTAFVRANPHFCAWTKTIYHERSKLGIQGQNHWLFPDLVGVHFPLEYRKEVLDIQKELSANSVRIFSFEMKRYLGLSNLRESYFQAISNSSWANEGYLVALDFAEEGEFQEELRRLNSAFGIGIIRLDADDVYQSEIVYPSHIENTIDWNTINKLADINEDFRRFLKSVAINTQHPDFINASEYDEVFSEEKLRDHVNTKANTKKKK